MVSLGSYLLGAVELAVVGALAGVQRVSAAERPSAGLGGRCRRAWSRSIVAVALLIWISEMLGTFGLFYAGLLVAAVLLPSQAAVGALAGGCLSRGGHSARRAPRGMPHRQDPPARGSGLCW